MPVEFSQPTWLQRDKGSGESGANWEVCGVDLVEDATATGNRLRLMLQGAVDV